MKMIFSLPLYSIRKNIGQSLSIVLSIVLSVSLIVSVNCLMYSAQVNQTESNRAMYGDYHYYFLADDSLAQTISNRQESNDYSIDNVQMLRIYDALVDEDSFNLVITYANSESRKMLCREIVEGEYPQNQREIAMDRYTLRSLNVEDTVGEEISFRGESFILSGIIKEPAVIDYDALEVYVSEDYENKISTNLIYLKFDENESLYNQVRSFARAFDIEEESLESNGKLINNLIDTNLERLINTVKITVEDEDANITTLLMRLQNDFKLTSGLVSTMLGVFSGFIIYSIFNVSITKRTREYGVLQTIGAGSSTIFLILLIELLYLFIISYPLGALLGLGAVKLLFQNLADLFSGKVSLVENTHTGSLINDVINSENIVEESFYVNKEAIVSCGIFLSILILLICIVVASRIKKKTVIELLVYKPKHFRRGTICCIKGKPLLNVLTNRFMFWRLGSFIGVIFSLAIGGTMILSTNYITINSKLNSAMVISSDDTLLADIKVSMPEGKFDYGITQEQLNAIENLPAITSASGFKYFIGESRIDEDALVWKSYWAEIANDPNWKQTPEILTRFNGIVVKNIDSYKIKTNIYGYDSNSLDTLKNFVIEGKIDQDKMNESGTVILRTIVDAQNKVNGLDIHAGDTITVKVPKNLNCKHELLRFESNDENYEEKVFTISAVVRESVVQNNEYISNEGLDIIMTNETMDDYFQIENYDVVAINKEQDDGRKVFSQIEQILQGTVGVRLVDNTVSIQEKNKEFERAEMLLYCVGILLIVISLFHIINTIFHLLDSRRYSFAVLRAMGITEYDFFRMLLKEAVKYGIYTCMLICILHFGIVQRIISYMLIHVYGYLNHITRVADALILMVFACVFLMMILSVAIPARRILKSNLTEELKSKM